jgi:hypothetical protein
MALKRNAECTKKIASDEATLFQTTNLIIRHVKTRPAQQLRERA